MDIQRWHAALIEARRDGLISDRTLGVAVMLATAVNWNRPEPGIYWSTAALLQATGLQRDAFYRARRELIETGLMDDIDGTLCPSDRRTIATDRGISATDRRNSATNMEGGLDGGTPRAAEALPSLTATTSMGEIAAHYPEHATSPDQFARMLACGLTVGIMRQWPGSPPIEVGLLVRLFTQALDRYSREVLFAAVQGWLSARIDDQSMRKPAAVFYHQSWVLFEETASLHTKEAQAL
jgi:hypothetical protein